MATIRKLSTFHQLSLNCDSPTLDQRRKSFKKQFSEQVSDKLETRTHHDRPHPVRIAWAETASPKDEGVVAKKCIKEIKKNSKISRHNSLEKDSILYSKQELAERLRQALKDREQEKPNLNIFLAHNTHEEDHDQNIETVTNHPPRIVAPMFTPMENIKNVFQMKKNKEVTYTPTPKSSTIVVIPVMEKNSTKTHEQVSTPPPSNRSDKQEDPKAIKNVIIRPATAAAKRERFQKRNNTAFNSIIKENGFRPPLVRSSSAPTRPEQVKPKFLPTKRKIKSGKTKIGKITSDDEDSVNNKENPKNKKEMNRYVAINGTDIVTMVSLISPAASDTEEIEIELKPKIRNSPAKTVLDKKEEKELPKNVSLRKTVKSVSFQSSSIHAIRSFSASFPGRRGSMATALMLNNTTKNQKNQEKRSTNSLPSEDEDRGPKRRLVRSATDKIQMKSTESEETLKIEIKTPRNDNDIKVDIKTKNVQEDKSLTTDVIIDSTIKTVCEDKKEEISEAGNDDNELKFGSVKEKECWEMYCKMADKGLKISYDTILRGMLTPTEYRMRRKESVTPSATGETNTPQVVE